MSSQLENLCGKNAGVDDAVFPAPVESETASTTANKDAAVGGSQNDAAEDSEEEIDELVRVDFPGFAKTDLLKNAKSVKFDGMLTDAPTCEIDGLKFIGHHEMSLGTQLVYRRPPDTGKDGFQGLCHRIIVFELVEVPSGLTAAGAAAGAAAAAAGGSETKEKDDDKDDKPPEIPWRTGISGAWAMKKKKTGIIGRPPKKPKI